MRADEDFDAYVRQAKCDAGTKVSLEPTLGHYTLPMKGGFWMACLNSLVLGFLLHDNPYVVLSTDHKVYVEINSEAIGSEEIHKHIYFR